MARRLLVAGLVGLLALAPLALAPQGEAQAQPRGKAPAAAPQQDWTRTVTRTAEGGYRMGNPAAPVQLVEYISLTCPACARFSAEASGPLAAQVRSGRLSFEIRNFTLNGADLLATLLTRCAPDAQYFAMTQALLADQQRWVGRISGLTDAQRAELRGMQTADASVRLAGIAGLDAIAARHGVPAARLRQCLSDQAQFDQLDRMAAAAEALGVSGTPTFLVNGRLRPGVHHWAELAPLLRPAS
jgi:protein-disulfide isomerase